MEYQLKQFGEDLADKVKQEGLSVAEFDTYDAIHVVGLLKQIFRSIARRRPMYFVSKNLDIPLAYTNALALLFADQMRLKSLIDQHNQRWIDQPQLHNEVLSRLEFWPPERFIGRRFHTVDVLKLMRASDTNTNVWQEILDYVYSEEFNKQYLLVIYNLSDIYTDPRFESGYGQQGYDLFWRSRSGLHFIAPLTWHDYAHRIEKGPRFLIQYASPVLFSPRPPDIPPCPHVGIEPDKRFQFNDPTK
jgi:hypothetical protein